MPSALVIELRDLSSGRISSAEFGKSPVRVGRNHLNEISLPDGFVSEYHGVFRFDEAGLSFTDLGSTNGTFSNGQRVAAKTTMPLPDDARLVIGKVEVRVRRVRRGMPTPLAPVAGEIRAGGPAQPPAAPGAAEQIPSRVPGARGAALPPAAPAVVEPPAFIPPPLAASMEGGDRPWAPVFDPPPFAVSPGVASGGASAGGPFAPPHFAVPSFDVPGFDLPGERAPPPASLPPAAGSPVPAALVPSSSAGGPGPAEGARGGALEFPASGVVPALFGSHVAPADAMPLPSFPVHTAGPPPPPQNAPLPLPSLSYAASPQPAPVSPYAVSPQLYATSAPVLPTAYAPPAGAQAELPAPAGWAAPAGAGPAQAADASFAHRRVLEAFGDGLVELRRSLEDVGLEIGVRPLSATTTLHHARDGREIADYLTTGTDGELRVAHLRQLFREIADHQQNVVRAVQESARALIEKLDPRAHDLEGGPKLFNVGKTRSLWREYVDQFVDLLEGQTALQEELFGEAFAASYSSDERDDDRG